MKFTIDTRLGLSKTSCIYHLDEPRADFSLANKGVQTELIIHWPEPSYLYSKFELTNAFCKNIAVPFEQLTDALIFDPYFSTYLFDSYLFNWRLFEIKAEIQLERNQVEDLVEQLNRFQRTF